MKKKILKLTAVILAIMLCLTGCSEVKEAQKAIDAMFASLNDGDYITARDAYISTMGGDNDFLGCGDTFDEENFPAFAMHEALFKSLEYKVVKKLNAEPARVTFLVEITALDLTPVADELFAAAEDYNFMAENSEGELDENAINEILTTRMTDISKDYINGENKKTKTTEIEVNVCYEKDRMWRVYLDDKLAGALTGNVYERYNENMQNYTSDDR